MRKVLLGAAALPLLAGCIIIPVPAAGGTCRSDGLAAFVGRQSNSATGTEILSASGARLLRWVQHGMAVTMEHNPERATVWLGPDNRIQRISCG